MSDENQTARPNSKGRGVSCDKCKNTTAASTPDGYCRCACHPTPPTTPADGFIIAITPDGRVWDAVNGVWVERTEEGTK